MRIIKKSKELLGKKVYKENLLPVCIVAFCITLFATLVLNTIFKLVIGPVM